MEKKILKLIILALTSLLLVFLAACGTDDEEDSSQGSNDSNQQEQNNDIQEEEKNESTELEGSVVIDGSGTVYPLMSRLAEEYMINEQQGVSVEVSRAGTSAGFQKFLVEENGTDFNDASRHIKDEEQALADELGIEVMELKVALDGLTFVIHPENDFVDEMTPEQLVDVFLGDINTWSEINPDWPNEEINTYGPNENHGTYEFFYENILDKQDLRDDVNLQQEYSTLVTLVSEDENALGFFGFGYYVNNQDQLGVVPVNFGDGPVEPSLNTIAEDGDYAGFTRPVFTYLNVIHAKEKPQVLDYAIFVMESVNDFVGEVGFAPIDESERQALVDQLEALK